MFNLLSEVKGYFKKQEIIIDDPIFRIHCTFTTALLMTFSLIITGTQFVGQPIRCIVDGVPQNVVNTYCWILTTFAMPDAFKRPYGSVAHPGVANSFNDPNQEKHYAYYQWVCFVLFFQAIMCYFPRWLWESWEKNLMKNIVCGLNIGLREEEEENRKNKSALIEYLRKHINEEHNWYAFRYWFCEVLCFVNIIFQMFVMDWFFDGDFLKYGLNVMFTLDDIDQDARYDHMNFIFPRVTKCTFRKFGPSSTIETHDALCILPLNIVNEKTYIFLWFWFIILSILCGFVIVFRLIIIICPRLRPRLMHAQNRLVPEEAVEYLCRKLSVGDWWLLFSLSKNLDPMIYKDVISKFAEKEKNDDAISKNIKFA